MADYRNLNLRFVLGGLNLASPPEQLQAGQLTRALNLRANVEGVIEGRRPTGALLLDQLTLGGHSYAYPSGWSTGPLRAIRYLGQITVDGDDDVEGYLSIHGSTPLPSGYSDSTYRTFINGAVVRKQTGYATYAVLDPTGLSVVRTSSPNGLHIILIDGQWYLKLVDLDLDSPHTTQNINTGYYNLTSVPTFNAKRLGIPKPAAAPTLATNGTGLTGDYYYRTSGYDATTGFQGPPSAISSVISLSNQGVRVTYNDTNTYGNFSHTRFWRLGGSLANTWRLVGAATSTNAGAGQTFDDTTTDADLALNEALDTDAVEVFNTIDSAGATSTGQKFNYAFGPFLGKYVFWVGDPVRKNYIYWNKLTDLARHDPSYDVNAVSDPGEDLLNGFIFGANPYVFSDKRLYALDFSGPEAQPAFSPREVPIGIGAAGRHAFAVAPNMVFICSKDGIYITDCQPNPPVNITDETLKPIFRGEARGDLEAIDYTNADSIRMEATNKELHFFYKGKSTGSVFHLVYDVQGGRWLEWSPNTFGTAYFNEGLPWNQLLLGSYNTQLIKVFDDVVENTDEAFNAQFRSAAMDGGAPLTHKEWGVLILDYDPRGVDITITPYYNSEEDTGTSFTTDTQGDVSGRRVQSFSLSDYYARSLSLDFAWNEEPNLRPKLYQALVLFREDEEDTLHWEHPPQSLGQSGPYHIKDSYWGVRSNAPITLTIGVDGRDDVYTHVIPNTNGVRKKIYVELLSRLGNVWSFKLDSVEPFRLYGEDCVLFAKPWQTGNSYQALTPFSQAGYAAYLRKGGGT